LSSDVRKRPQALVPTTVAAPRLGITPKHLRYLARTGQVPRRRLGNQWMFFEAWLNWMTTWIPAAAAESGEQAQGRPDLHSSAAPGEAMAS